MTSPRPDAPPIPLAGDTLDRAAERRGDEAWVAAARADERARAVLVGRDGVAIEGRVTPDPSDPWAQPRADGALRAARVPLPGGARDEAVLLGLEDGGVPLFAVPAPPDAELVGLREAAALLPAADAGLLAYATAILRWQRSHRFCGHCGGPTAMREAGHLRVCARGHHHHPRTDPVVIMLVVDGDRCLLGRQSPWPARRYSALAGFVEPGESLESAVVREVREESAVTVGKVRYRFSQPWPFPASLMLGFEADYASGEAHAADAELADVRWFGRDELLGAADDRPDAPLLLPPTIAIARHLLEAWLAGGQCRDR